MPLDMGSHESFDIAVTGMGLVTPLGANLEENVQQIALGRSAIRGGVPPQSESEERPLALCEIADIAARLRVPKSSKYFSRSVTLAMYAVLEAVEQSGLRTAGNRPERIGVYTGSGQTGIDFPQFGRAVSFAWKEKPERNFDHLGGWPSRLIDPNFSLRTLANGGTAAICIELDAQGPSHNFVHSDTSSAAALQAACDDLVAGRCDIAIAGGHDSLVHPGMIHAFHHGGMLSPAGSEDALRPFDVRTSGLAPGEGAAFFVLERVSSAEHRQARILARLIDIDIATSSIDAPPVPRANETIPLLVCGMKDRFGIPDLIVAQGLGIAEDDQVELNVLAGCARRVAVTALKGYTGYSGAATAAAELAIGLGCARSGFIPSVGRAEQVPVHHLDLITGQARRLTQQTVSGIFVACGWGGQTSAIYAQTA